MYSGRPTVDSRTTSNSVETLFVSRNEGVWLIESVLVIGFELHGIAKI
jgi:hypothetical protein